MGELNLDELERLAKAAGADAGIGAWEASDCAVWFPDGDGAMRVGERALVGIAHANLGAWPEMVDEEAVAEHIAAACPDTILSLIARIRELTSDRDSWCNQAADRLKDWDDMRQRAEAAEKRIRELEQDAARYQHVRAHGMPKLCPAGFYYHDGVFYPTADAAIDAYMAAIDAARKEKGHG